VRDVLDATSKVLFSRRKTRAESIAFCDRLTIRVAPAPRTPLQKQSAGRHEAFRRSNCAFLTLVGKSDAKSRHSKILVITAVTGFKLRRLIDDDLGKIRKRNSEIGKRIFALRTLDEELIRMVFLAEDEVPGEVRHQADVAGDAKLQARADLTERSEVIVGNRIIGQVFALAANETVLEGVLLIKKLIEGRATVNEADAAGDVGSKAAERIAPG